MPINEAPGYEVSDLGRVRSVTRVTTRVYKNYGPREYRLNGQSIAPCIKPNGYWIVVLAGNRAFHVHRLVAMAFIAGDATLTVNHKDGDKSNNRLTNLEWMSIGQNIKHSFDTGLRKPPRQVPVTVGGVAYPNQSAAGRALGVCAGSISSARRLGHKVCGLAVSK